MNRPREQNSTNGAVIISYWNKKIIFDSLESNISVSNGKAALEPVQHKWTLQVQTK
jgi:hypothetical protein